MRAVQGAVREAVGFVAGGALGDGAGMALQLHCRDIVVGIRVAVRPDGMRTAVAGLTAQAGMTIQTVAVQGIVIFGKTLGLGR